MMQYAQDYDETFCPNWTQTGTGGSVLWYQLLEPYVKNTQVFSCPSAVLPGSYPHAYGYLDYAVCINFCVDRYGVKMATIKYPAETVLGADGDWTRSTADYSTNNSYRFYYSFHPSAFIPSRHNGGANMWYCDGHAKWHEIALDPNSTYVGPVKYTIHPTDIAFYASGAPKY